MEITRINHYTDERFSARVLKQHGAFLIDQVHPCEFEIINEDTAIINYHDYCQIEPIITKFRFYAEHIVNFVDSAGRLLKSYPPVDKFWLDLDEIQPSQFFVDAEKVAALEEFIKQETDVIIPVIKTDQRYISLDGHTRLYLAHQKGFNRVQGFIADTDEYIYGFVNEAKLRGIHYVSDIKKISHEDYQKLWHQFCDDFFAKVQAEKTSQK